MVIHVKSILNCSFLPISKKIFNSLMFSTLPCNTNDIIKLILSKFSILLSLTLDVYVLYYKTMSRYGRHYNIAHHHHHHSSQFPSSISQSTQLSLFFSVTGTHCSAYNINFKSFRIPFYAILQDNLFNILSINLNYNFWVIKRRNVCPRYTIVCGDKSLGRCVYRIIDLYSYAQNSRINFSFFKIQKKKNK